MAEDITFDTPDDALNTVPVEEVVEETAPVTEEAVETKAEEVPEAKEEPKPEEPHKKSGIQKLKDQRNREREAKEKAERELAELRARNSVLTDAEGKPSRPDEAKFDTYEALEAAKDEYQIKLMEWTIAERERKSLKYAEEMKAKEIQTYQEARVKSFHAAHPDLGQLLTDLDRQNVPFTPQMKTIIDDSEVGGEILHFLAKNPEEIFRIASLSTGKQMKELGLLEDRFTEQEPMKPTKPVSHVPKPISPVSGGYTVTKVRDGDMELY